MGIKYKNDKDLIFLQFCQETDLATLCKILTTDKDNKPRISGEILNHQDYKKYEGHPNQNQKCWHLLAGELQHFGGDSIINLLRQNGILYKEILCNVCDKINIKYNKLENPHIIEITILDFLLRKSWEKMTNEQRKNLLHQINHEDFINNPNVLDIISSLLFTSSYIARIIALYIAQIVIEIIFASTITVAGGQALLRAIGGTLITGPVGLTLGAALAVPSISGPAYRVTIPAVIQIAYMRRTLTENNHF